MPITYLTTAGEAPTINPNDSRGPWTIQLPDTTVNGTAVTLKIWPAGQTPVTVTALGAGAVVEDPLQPGVAAASITISTQGVGAAQWIYNAGLNVWGLYGGAAMRQVGRGEMRAENDALPPIDNTWQSLVFDSITQPGHGLVMAPGIGEFTFLWPGWWEFRTQINVSHNESNTGRTTFLRIYDITDSVQLGTSAAVPIARNQGGFLVSITLRFLITPDNVGDVFRLEIGNGDTLTNVVLNSHDLSFTQITSSVE